MAARSITSEPAGGTAPPSTPEPPPYGHDGDAVALRRRVRRSPPRRCSRGRTTQAGAGAEATLPGAQVREDPVVGAVRVERGRVLEDAVGAQLAAKGVPDLAHTKLLRLAARRR